MDSSRWNNIKRIFAEAAEAPPAGREAILVRACGDDAALRQEVDKLLLQLVDTETVDIFRNTPGHSLNKDQVLAGRFKIKRFLGKGGMGEVYEAEDQTLGGSIALKVLRPELAAQPVFVQRFRREVLIARQATHLNICRVFDVGVDGANVFLTMEFLSGQTLTDYLHGRGPIPESEALPLALQLADGLTALHTQGIVHRDFKPSNVMVCQASHGTSRIVINDFGLARAMEIESDLTAVSRTGQILGTPDYMAPEQLLGAQATPASDIYAFGLVLYQIVSGKRPPAAHSPLRSIDSVSAPWSATILQCLERDPGRRPASAAHVIAQLGGGPQTAVHSPTRRRWLWPAAGVLGAAALGFTMLYVAGGLPLGAAAPHHVAVLPLRVVRDEAGLSVLAAGLVEAITARLTQFEGGHAPLLVVPASEVRSQDAKTAADAKRKFQATDAIEGSLQIEGDRIRLTITIVETAAMRQAETIVIEELRSNSLRLQDEAMARLATALNLRLRPKYAAQMQPAATSAPNAYDYYLQARGYLQRSDQLPSLDNAILLASRALSLDPHFALAHAALAEAYLSKFEQTRDRSPLELARASAQEAVRLAPAEPAVQTALGRVQLATGLYPEARQSFEKALEIDERYNDAVRGLAGAFLRLNNFPAAEAAYLRAIALQPAGWVGYKQLGGYYYERGAFDKAVAQWRRVVDLSPDNAQGYVNLSAGQARLERWDDAEKTLLRALALEPDRLGAITNLAKVYYEKGDFPKAIDYYKRGLNANNRSHLRWGLLGSAYKRVGDEIHAGEALRRALELLDDEIKTNPKRLDLLAQAGFYRAMLQRPDYKQPLEMVLASPAAELETLATVAEAYAAAGDKVKAIELIKTLHARGYNTRSFLRSPWVKALLPETGIALPP